MSIFGEVEHTHVPSGAGLAAYSSVATRPTTSPNWQRIETALAPGLAFWPGTSRAASS